MGYPCSCLLCKSRRVFLDSLTVESETDEATFPWTDKKASDMQSNIAISNGRVTGTLKFIEGGLSPAGPLAGDGYFIALKWSNIDANATSLKVGLVPSSSGMEPQECINDPDHNGVFKITDKSTQVVKFILSDGEHTEAQTLDLSELTLGE